MVTVESARKLCAKIKDAAAAAGRPTPTIAMWVGACVDPGEAAIAQMTRSKVGYLAAPGYSDMFVEAGFGELVEFAKTRPHPKELLKAMPAQEIAKATTVVGSLGEVEARIGEYFDAGVDEVCLVRRRPTTRVASARSPRCRRSSETLDTLEGQLSPREKRAHAHADPHRNRRLRKPGARCRSRRPSKPRHDPGGGLHPA